jgi:hypothetical protein
VSSRNRARNVSVYKREATRPPAAQQRLSAQRAAAARARTAAAQRRRRLLTVGASVGAVLIVVAVLVAVKLVTGAGGPRSGKPAARAAGSLTARLSAIPVSVFNNVGADPHLAAPTATNGAALTANGKPRVLYIGAEYCPYCAATRWPVAVALSRFGRLRDLGQVRSSPSDVYPSTATLSFHGADYTSAYLSFTGKEVQSNQVVGGNYSLLDRPSAADRKTWQAAGGGYPFLDLGGRWLLRAAPFTPSLLHGLNQDQIVAALSDPSSAIARAVDGSANELTAGICRLTGGKPGSVCNSPGVRAAAARLPDGS